MQTILLLHDLDLKPDFQQINFLKDKGYNVISPWIDYRASKGQMYLQESMQMLVGENDVWLMIGTGLGGYLASSIGGPNLISIYPANRSDLIDLPVPKYYSGEQFRNRITVWGSGGHLKEGFLHDYSYVKIIDEMTFERWSVFVPAAIERFESAGQEPLRRTWL